MPKAELSAFRTPNQPRRPHAHPIDPNVAAVVSLQLVQCCSSNLNPGSLVGIVAVLRAGKSVVLLNPGLGDDVLRTNLSDADVSAIVARGCSERVRRLVLETGGMALDGSGIEEHRTSRAPNVPSGSDEWGVLYSSGTTGVPKGIERDHESMATEFLGWIIELALGRDTAFYIGRPVYYTGGLVLAAATLIAGGTVVFDDLSAENDSKEAWRKFVDSLGRESVEWAFFIPDQLRVFLREDPGVAKAPSNILVMGGPISGDEKIAVSQFLDCAVVESWGNSESLGTITEKEDLDTRPTSIGRPFLCDEMCIVDDDLVKLGPGQTGRIAGGVEGGFSRYSNRPDATKTARRGDLIISEDYGYQDEDGYFYILGRASDNVVRHGESIFLSQIESQLRAHPGVDDCCVTSVGDEHGVLLVALVASSSTVQPEKLRTSVNERLRVAEGLDRVLLVELPRLPSGKLDRVQCKTIAAKSYGA